MEVNKLTKEEKNLLIKVLSEMLPYGVMIQHPELFYPSRIVIEKLVSIDGEHINDDGIDIEYIKPYLRSLEDMTEEEKKEFLNILGADDIKLYGLLTESYAAFIQDMEKALAYIRSKHFNINLPEHLYIRVTKENNPYDTKKV